MTRISLIDLPLTGPQEPPSSQVSSTHSIGHQVSVKEGHQASIKEGHQASIKEGHQASIREVNEHRKEDEASNVSQKESIKKR